MGFHKRFMLKLRATSPHSRRFRANAGATIWRQRIDERYSFPFAAIGRAVTIQASGTLISRLATAIRELACD